MRTRAGLLGVVTVAVHLTSCVWGGPAVKAYHVVCAKRVISAGEQAEVRLEPCPPRGTYVYWRNARQIGMPPATEEACRAVYTAPFVIAPGSPPAEIRVDLSGPRTGRVGFVGHVDLIPSALAGSADCLAPGQTYSPEYGTVEPDSSQVLRAEGVVVHMTDPEYPRVAVTRGLTDVVPLSVLLCTSGRVLVAYLLTSYDDNWQPVEHERVLTEAAVTIAQSRTFAPLLRNGTPVAGWIHVHVAFRR